jgi:hypothetical protein
MPRFFIYEVDNMVLEILKYNSVVSIPLFTIIALFLLKKARGFSYSKSTFSKSIIIMKGRAHGILFRLNFILKALLDYGFVFYLIDRLEIPFFSILALSMLLSVTFFGLLFYFTEGRFSFIHHFLVYANGVLWCIAQVFLANLTGNYSFILFTYVLSVVVLSIEFGFLFAKKTNVFVQAICWVLFYIWLLVYVFKFL